MREIWMMQPRFEKRVGSAPFGLVEQPRFRAGFDFMRLRADIGEVDEVLADWWQEFSMADDNLRQDMVDQVREEQHTRQRARAPRVHTVPAAPDTAPAAVSGEGGEPSQAPRKRRRRRRSGAAKNQGAGPSDSGM
jgi:poly(A) polymerase